jgi:hypothetical protein
MTQSYPDLKNKYSPAAVLRLVPNLKVLERVSPPSPNLAVFAEKAMASAVASIWSMKFSAKIHNRREQFGAGDNNE